jgi:hypothetical protein
MVPVRGETTELAATENWNAPFPWPFVVPDNEIHAASADADQVQSRSVETDTVPLPPDGGNDVGEPDTATWQRDGGRAAVTEVAVDDPQLEAPMAVPTSAASTPARRSRPTSLEVQENTAAMVSKPGAR